MKFFNFNSAEQTENVAVSAEESLTEQELASVTGGYGGCYDDCYDDCDDDCYDGYGSGYHHHRHHRHHHRSDCDY